MTNIETMDKSKVLMKRDFGKFLFGGLVWGREVGSGMGGVEVGLEYESLFLIQIQIFNRQ